MTKEDIKAELARLGVKHHHSLGLTKLEALLREALTDKLPAEVKEVEEVVAEVAEMPSTMALQELLPAIPNRQGAFYEMLCDDEHCEVFKTARNGKKELIRVYTTELHFGDYKACAISMTNKLNNRNR